MILGAFSRKKKLELNRYQEVIQDFSLQGNREVDRFVEAQLLFSSYSPWSEQSSLAESADASKVLLFAGAVYGLPPGENCAAWCLRGWEEKGEGFLKALNGTFSFACYDREKRELTLVNDSFGLYPLFVFATPDHCLFCSEYEPLLALREMNRELDYEAVGQYFKLGSPLGERTFFKEIKNLAPGSILRIGESQELIQKNYDPLDLPLDHSAASLGDRAAELAELIRNAVQNRVKLHPKPLLSLTGGLDTRLILSNLSEEQRKVARFQTFATPFLSPEKDKDVIIARMLAKRLGLDHEVVEEPLWSSQWAQEFEVSVFDKWRVRTPEKHIVGLLGGEFLNGDCFPFISGEITPYLDQEPEKKRLFKRISSVFSKKTDPLLEQIFGDSMARKMGDPFEALQSELKGIQAENKALAFAIQYFTRGFFTNI